MTLLKKVMNDDQDVDDNEQIVPRSLRSKKDKSKKKTQKLFKN
jgi:hypothetical protein